MWHKVSSALPSKFASGYGRFEVLYTSILSDVLLNVIYTLWGHERCANGKATKLYSGKVYTRIVTGVLGLWSYVQLFVISGHLK